MFFSWLVDTLARIICAGLGVAFIFLVIAAVILIIGETKDRW